MQTFGK